MTPPSNFCRTENRRRRRGRPAKAGRSVRVTVRFREGEHDAILHRLRQLPRGRWSAYVRRVLDGAPPEALDDALAVESQALTAALDGMWNDDWADE